ncbi:hypothetical protein [Alginatibacterium sediminis]|uniref:hypothetical protein n=1 Tax=Alginatibacterium sediminis TaxID=2164068 RepID=UPI0018F77101|nr:hypothetical protein [Alginatibacterium sediminis]
MRFINENNEQIEIANDMTLAELYDMGVSISLSEENDPEQQIWLTEEHGVLSQN